MADKELGFPREAVTVHVSEDLLRAMCDKADEVDKLVAEHGGMTNEHIDSLTPRERKSQRAALNKKKGEFEESRKAATKALRDAEKEINAVGKRWMAGIDSIIAMYDAGIARDKANAEKVREDGLRSYYAEIAGILAEHIPFEEMLDPDWLKSDAKYKAAFDTLLDVCKRLSDDWAAVKRMKGNLFDYDEVERELFRTRNLREALENDQRRREEAERLKAFKEERAQYIPESYEPPERGEGERRVFEEVEPEPAPMPENHAEPALAPQERKRYTFTVLLDDREVKALQQWKNENEIGGDWHFQAVDALAEIAALRARVAELERMVRNG